jgi:alkaline phosphatase
MQQVGIIRRVALLATLALLTVAAWAGPKNVIVMIGDGMGPDEVYAAGAYQFGPTYHMYGGDKRLAMETLTGMGYSTTYCAGGGTTDSAAAATALACGVKTYNGAIGVVKGPTGKNVPVRSITEIAQAKGLKTGIVTTKSFIDATPAGFGAHQDSRKMYRELANDMLFKTKPDVVMGSGNPNAAPAWEKSTKYPTEEDWAYLHIVPAQWRDLGAGKTSYTLIQQREDFQKLIATPATGKVFGCFLGFSFITARGADNTKADPKQPTLKEMTLGTLNTLDNPKGFFAMIEGGLIDERGHANDLDGNIGETLGFDETIQATIDWIAAHGGWEQNLLIITADHETGYLRDIKPTEAGKLPTAAWGPPGRTGTGVYADHTSRIVPLYFQGAGSEAFAKYLKPIKDVERGDVQVMDNTEIFQVMKAAVAGE